MSFEDSLYRIVGIREDGAGAELYIGTAFAVDGFGHLLTMWTATMPTGHPEMLRADPESGLEWDSLVVEGFGGGPALPVEIVARDRDIEAALLRIPAQTRPLNFSAFGPTGGEPVVIFGFPESLDNGFSHTTGTVMGVRRLRRFKDTRPALLYDLEIPAEHGYCGAPILTRNGVVGHYVAGGLNLDPPQPGLGVSSLETLPYLERHGVSPNVNMKASA